MGARLWTKEEDALLVANWNGHPKIAASVFNGRRTLKAVTLRAQRLGIRTPYIKPTRFKAIQIDRDFLMWLAGFIDGEGTIALYPAYKHRARAAHSQYFPRLSIANTNFDLLAAIKAKIGGGIRSNFNAPGNSRPAHQLQINSFSRVAPILLALRPHLKLKAMQCELVLEYADAWIRLPRGVQIERAEELYLRLKKLNRKGLV